MNDFQKRVYAIKELYPTVTQNTATEAFDENSNKVEVDETAIANKIAEMDTARETEAQSKEDLKASAKAKLMAGEALTEDEANVMIGG
jgi:uncharacterized coiled-coil DUF342 family protein